MCVRVCVNGVNTSQRLMNICLIRGVGLRDVSFEVRCVVSFALKVGVTLIGASLGGGCTRMVAV